MANPAELILAIPGELSRHGPTGVVQTIAEIVSAPSKRDLPRNRGSQHQRNQSRDK